MDFVQISERVRIPMAELRFSFDRSSGPGGQHVNKVNTRVELRFAPASSAALTEEQRRRLGSSLRGRLTRDGSLIVRSSRFRSQLRNRHDCLEKFAQLLADALRPPPPPRRRSRPGRAAVARRLQSKKLQSLKKTRRSRPGLD